VKESLESLKAMRRRRILAPENFKKLFILVLTILSLSFFCYSGSESQDSREGQTQKNKNDLVLLPVAYYTPLTKIAGGLGGIYYLKTMEDLLKGSPSTIFMDLIYTQRKQIVGEITPNLYLKKGEFNLTGYLGFKDFADKFYGIGADTSADMEEAYSYRSLKFNLSVRKRYGANLYIGLQYDFEYFRPRALKPGGILESVDIVGSQGGNVSGLGGLLIWDSRDDVFFPTRGIFLQASAALFVRPLGSAFRFQRISLDFRQYVTLFSNHVLAFQESIQSASGTIPFQWLPMMGGPWVMRGYILGRFRDKNSMVFQFEYRLPLVWKLGAAGFFGLGNVVQRMSQLKLDDFKLAGGFGIRYRLKEGYSTNIRLDFGFARGSFGVYAMINEAF
jgi:outer membrane protein assembly factor BamA